MKRIYLPLLALLCLCANVSAQKPIALSSTDPAADYTDLLPLKNQLSHATVIGAGEGTHGSREFFRMKHRLFRFLAEEMGFTVFAMEDSPVGAALIQKFVDTGEGNPAAIIREHFHKVYQVQELSDFVYWMRDYNLHHDKKLRFAGFDCQQMHYFHQQLTELSTRYDLPCFAPLLNYTADTGVTFSKAMEPVIRICDSLIRVLPAEMKGVSDEDWRLARFWLNNILAAAHEFQMQEGDWEQSFNTRDSMMANNIFWIAEKYKGEKMMLWAHNSHLGNVYSDSGFVFRPMGGHLRKAYGQRYQNIAMLTGTGTYRAQPDHHVAPDTGHAIVPPIAGSAEAQLQAYKIPMFILPLKYSGIRGRMRTIGSIASEYQFTLWPVALLERFDWVVYMEKTSSAATL
ncbi:erythromycin esterase family protein [Chitinophaga rhizosphaerae]|uniref:erythromycin esterase family protein n=1 Tax=Chitinophaga rhizosphaerae TaxID=1864947 RepID=UPI000F805739|nr:erythromycin esterase family protein [Chitinophaga rhizosphaerae]